jgi:hypothetical protein
VSRDEQLSILGQALERPAAYGALRMSRLGRKRRSESRPGVTARQTEVEPAESGSRHAGGPLVSILTPSFNQARWLGDNLRSVRRQTYEHIEHIVMDGGSTDDSVAVLEADCGPRVVWRSEPNAGQSDAINKALRRSTGEIIGWLNSDDAYFSRTVQHVVDVFARHPDVDVVYGHAALVGADGFVLHGIWSPPFDRSLLRHYNFVVQPTVFVRRSAIGCRLVDASFDSEMDRELRLRLSQTSRFMRINRVIAVDRHQPGRTVYTQKDIAAKDERELVRLYGLPTGRWFRARRKLLKVMFRIAGARLTTELLSAPLAFAGKRDSRRALLVRQFLIPRSRLPYEHRRRAEV